MRTRKLDRSVLLSAGVMIAFILVFAILSGGKVLAGGNIIAIIDRALQLIIAGLGVIFVMAMGSADMSVGTTLAIATVLGCAMYAETRSNLLFFALVFGVSLLCGLIAGIMVAIFHVPSFMTTLSMLIGIRGLVNFLIDRKGVASAPPSIHFLSDYRVKIILMIVFIIIAIYLMEFTRLGKYVKAIGENENAVSTVGIPVKKVKILAFVISGFMAGVAGLFMTAQLSGTNYSMGSNFELQVIMIIFLGGVAVTGGNSAKVPKMLIGAITFAVIENGLVLCGWTSTDVKQIVEGILLMLVLFISIRVNEGMTRSEEKKAAEKA